MNTNDFYDTNSIDLVLKKNITYSLYFSLKYNNNSGIRVEKASCWKKLIDFFSSSPVAHRFSVKTIDDKILNVMSYGFLKLN